MPPTRTLTRTLLATFLRVVTERAWLVLGATVAITAACAHYAASLPLATDLAQLLPERARSVTEQRRSEQYLGNTALHVVLVSARGHDAATRARAAAQVLADRMAADPELGEIFFRLDTDFFASRALLYLPLTRLSEIRAQLEEKIRRQVLAENPLFIDLEEEDDDDLEEEDDDDADEVESNDWRRYLSPEERRRMLEERTGGRVREYVSSDDGSAYLVLAQPPGGVVDFAYNRQIVARVLALVKELDLSARFGPDLTLEHAGGYYASLEEHVATTADLRNAGALSLVLLVLVIVIYFRSMSALLVIFLPLLSGVVNMMAYIRASVGQLNTITGFTFALFMGLSIDFAIHLLVHYREQRGRGRDLREALVRTYQTTGRAALIAGLTSSAAFLALLLADFRGFREFGIIASGGTVICLGTIAVQMPALLALTERRSRRPARTVARTAERADAQPGERSGPTRLVLGPALGLIGLLGALALGSASRSLAWEHDFRNLRGGSAATVETAVRAFELLGYSPQPALRIADSLAEARALSDACERERQARGSASTVLFCVSLADFVPDEQAAKLEVLADIRALLSECRLDAVDDPALAADLRKLRAQLPERAISARDLPAQIRRNFLSATGDKYFVKAYPAVMTWDTRNNTRFTDELLAIDSVSPSDIGPTGPPVVMADVQRIMKRDAADVAGYALAAVFLIILLGSRSFTYALACHGAMVLGIWCTAGIMALIDLKLGFYNMVAVPLLIGVGVDNNIHLFRRYHEEGRGSWPLVVRTTGVACIVAAVTTIAGFAGLLFASHLGLQTIGRLAIIGITACTAVSLLLVPALLGALERLVTGTAFGMLPGHHYRAATSDMQGRPM